MRARRKESENGLATGNWGGFAFGEGFLVQATAMTRTKTKTACQSKSFDTRRQVFAFCR
jgi:hypothetical protein